MRNMVIAAAAALFALAASAQEALQCANPEFLNGVVFGGRIEMTSQVTRSLPAAMSAFRAPADFKLIGTARRDEMNLTTVAYKTSQSKAQAFNSLKAALASDGWPVEANPYPGSTFNSGDQPLTATVCRNGERRHISVAEAAGTRYASIMLIPEAERLGCGSQADAFSFERNQRLLPRFDFPQGTGMINGGGSGGSNDSVHTSSRISSKDSAADIVQHLADQLSQQGWNRDSGWSSRVSAGGTWRRTVDGRAGWGNLEITGVAADLYEVSFTLLLRPE